MSLGIDTLVADDYNRADGSAGGNYTGGTTATSGTGPPAIVSNKLAGQGTLLVTLPATTTPDYSVETDIDVAKGHFEDTYDPDYPDDPISTPAGTWTYGYNQIFLRYVDSTHYYAVYIGFSAAGLYYIGIIKNNGSGDANLTYTAITADDVSYSKLRGEVEGTAIRLYLDNTLMLSTTDATFTAVGKYGVQLYHSAYGVGGTADNLIAKGTAASGGAALLAGAAAMQMAGTAAMTTQVRFAGAAATVMTGTGQLTTALPIGGAALNQISAAGTPTTAISFAGAATVTVGADGNPSTQIPLSGAAIMQALAAAGLTSALPLGGDAADVVAALGALTIQIRLDGGAVMQMAATGALASPSASLAGAAQMAMAAAGDPVTQIALAGAALVLMSGAGNVSTMLPMAGAAAFVIHAQGSLTVEIPLNGAALMHILAGGDLTAIIRMNGSAVMQATATGALAGRVYQANPQRTLMVPAVRRHMAVAAKERVWRVA